MLIDEAHGSQAGKAPLRYYFALKTYIEDKGYRDLKALVAFSGELHVNGNTYTEAELNGFGEGELPKRFDTPEYQILIVAEKYQTGFDQPSSASKSLSFASCPP